MTTLIRSTAILGLMVGISSFLRAQVVTESWSVRSNADIGFAIDFLEVANPGNSADTDGGIFRYDDGTTRKLGAVPYAFQISKYAISREMIELADVISESEGAIGPLGIPLTNIRFFGGESDDSGDKPANGLSWNHAARFVNWMTMYRGLGSPTYRFETQPGDPDYNPLENAIPWDEDSPHFDPDNPLRSRVAQFALPTVDEWYKAAYHDASSGVAGNYFDYATGSDEKPSPVSRGTEANTAVFDQPEPQGPAPVQLAGGPSPYGTVGQGGNGYEFMESHPRQQNWVQLRGGPWMATDLKSDMHVLWHPSAALFINGFRVVMLNDRRHEPLFGDFDDDLVITTNDLDLLSEIDFPNTSPELSKFDLNGDDRVTEHDRELWIERAALTRFGDLNLDGDVSFHDFLTLSSNYSNEGGYAEGDINGDGDVGFADFLILSENFGKRAANAVPEPSSAVLLLIGFCFLRCRRQALLTYG